MSHPKPMRVKAVRINSKYDHRPSPIHVVNLERRGMTICGVILEFKPAKKDWLKADKATCQVCRSRLGLIVAAHFSPKRAIGRVPTLEDIKQAKAEFKKMGKKIKKLPPALKPVGPRMARPKKSYSQAERQGPWDRMLELMD